MIAFDSQSYPWLAIAQHYNVPYGKVLAIVEALEAGSYSLPLYLLPETRWQFVLHQRWTERKACGRD